MARALRSVGTKMALDKVIGWNLVLILYLYYKKVHAAVAFIICSI